MRTVRGSQKGWFNLRAKKKGNWWMLKCYRKRHDKLLALGFESYNDYLQTPEWKSIRSIKLSKQPDCPLCQNSANQVHHMSYDTETLLGFKEHRLVALCSSCHKDIEYDGEQKNDLRRANKKLFTEAEKTPKGLRWINSVNSKEGQFKKEMKEKRKKKKQAKIKNRKKKSDGR